MIFQTWPTGTQKIVTVLEVRTVRPKDKPPYQIVVAVEEATKQGFFLVGAHWPDAKPGAVGTIAFAKGGPLGGYWKHQPTPNPATPDPTHGR